jgi:signal transduction histidine kinase
MSAAGLVQGAGTGSGMSLIGLRRALVALAAAGFGSGVVLALMLATSDHVQLRGLEATLALIVGWGFIGAGLYAWWRRPQNNFGPLMTLTGFLFFVSEAAASNNPVVFTVSTLLGNLFLAVVVHMLLAMPSGRLRTTGERVLVVATYIFCSPISRAWVFFAEPSEFGCDRCPDNVALISNQPDLAHATDTATNVGALTIFAFTLLFLWRHWQAANTAERRALGPVALTGAAVLVLLEIGLIAEMSGHSSLAQAGYYATQAAILPLPYAFVASLARSRLKHADAVSGLVARLAHSPGQEEIRAAIADALDDPSLALAYWLPEFGTYADVDGHAIELVDGDGRATTLIRRDGEPIAALLHDAALCEEPDLLDAVAAAAAIALENVRLNVELRARLDELKGSRARIVEAGDAERRRLERNLHDGAQQRLVSVALQLRLLQNRIRGDPQTAESLVTEVRDEVAQSLEELRELARGLHPAVLEHGLGPALQAVATRSRVPVTVSCAVPGRLPQPVELAAYFVACEALTNVAKYASASAATVRAWHDNGVATIEIADDGVGGAHDSGGSGLRGLADRVEALDGRLHVVSPAGAGTVVTAELPCEP